MYFLLQGYCARRIVRPLGFREKNNSVWWTSGCVTRSLLRKLFFLVIGQDLLLEYHRHLLLLAPLPATDSELLAATCSEAAVGITGADVEKLTAVGLPRPVGHWFEPVARRMEKHVCDILF